MTTAVVIIIVPLTLASVLILWLLGRRGRLMQRSTLSMVRESGLIRFLSLATLHGCVYFRWTKEYVRLGKTVMPYLGSRIGRWIADRYHGKVLTSELAQAIVAIDHDVSLRDLEQIIPYSMARDLVLRGNPDIVAYECACRQNSAEPCQPTQVCMVVGQPFASFVLEHHHGSSRHLDQAEALELLEAERERGHLQSAWFKDTSMGRFYAICNCCKCCCAAVEAMRKHGIPVMAPSGYVARMEGSSCDACGRCVVACPFAALSMSGNVLEVNWEQCMGCGACQGQCPRGAISLVRDERKGHPLDVRLLARQ